MVDGTWTDLDPLKPDLFIEDKDSQGIQNFDGLTGLTVHLIVAADSEGGVMNLKSPPETKVVSQKRLLLRKEVHTQPTLVGPDGLKGYWLGWCYGGPGPPPNIDECVIYPRNIRHWIEDSGDFVGLDPAAREAMIERVTVQAIRHELGHAVNMVHHEPEHDPPYDIMAYPLASVLIPQPSAYSNFVPHELVDRMQLR